MVSLNGLKWSVFFPLFQSALKKYNFCQCPFLFPRPHFSSRPKHFRSRDYPSVRLGYVTETNWPRGTGKTPYRDWATSVQGRARLWWDDWRNRPCSKGNGDFSRAQDLTRRRSSWYGLQFQEGKQIFFAEINQINKSKFVHAGSAYRDLAQWHRRLVLQINVKFETFNILYLIFSIHNHVSRWVFISIKSLSVLYFIS